MKAPIYMVLAALAGCGSPPPPQPAPAVLAHEPSAAPSASSPPAAAPTASASATQAPAPAPTIAPPAALVDPAKLKGYVMSRNASSAIPDQLDARVSAVDSKDVNENLVEWWISLQDKAGATHGVGVYAPKGLPPSVAQGDQVHVSLGRTGGGPNRRLNLVFEASDGSLLLAVSRAPDAWKVTRGKAEGTQPANGYTETAYGVEFEFAGAITKLKNAGWTRIEAGGNTYYLWGNAVERKLAPGKKPMPDYVAGWLDFGILRAR